MGSDYRFRHFTGGGRECGFCVNVFFFFLFGAKKLKTRFRLCARVRARVCSSAEPVAATCSTRCESGKFVKEKRKRKGEKKKSYRLAAVTRYRLIYCDRFAQKPYANRSIYAYRVSCSVCTL